MKKYYWFLSLFLGILFSSITTNAQELNEKLINKEYNEVALTQILNEWEQYFQSPIYYKKEWINDILVTENFTNLSVDAALKKLLSPYQFYSVYYDNSFIILKTSDRRNLELELNNNNPNTIVIGERDFSVTKATLTGYIKGASSSERLIGATVMLGDQGVVTDSYGYYSITVPPGNYELKVSYLGWHPETKDVRILSNGKLDIELYESVTQIEEVVIRGRADDANVTDNQMSTISVPLNSIKELPALLGEVDVYRTILQLPGVSTVGEGSAGVNVRGGDVQENLILVDNIPIYNSSHVFGFFSTINADLIENFSLMKGGIDPKYGGRTSAVLKMDMKSGDKYEWKAKGAVSNLSSKLAIEGPLAKEKASIIVGGRMNYSDYLLKAIKDPELSQSSAQFKDFGTKISVNLNDKNSLSILGYYSTDRFRFAGDTTYNYVSYLGGVDWVSVISSKLSTSVSASYSAYANDIEGLSTLSEYRYTSGIGSFHVMGDGVYSHSLSNTLNFGVAYNQYMIDPGAITPNSQESIIDDIDLPDENAREFVAYINDNIKINPSLTFSAGVRFVNYQKIGEGVEYLYQQDAPRIRENIIDTLQFSAGDEIKSYSGFEPRISLSYLLRHNISIKASYQRSRQFLHQLNNAVALSPFAIWKSSGMSIKPQTSDQWAVGYFQNFKDNIYEASLEGYYRKSSDVVEYKNLASLVLADAVETQLLSGEGEAYGLEFFLRKQKGRLKGWLSYTYSRAFVKVISDFSEESVNNGEFFPSNFDKPHILSASVNYELSKRWVFASNFSYSTGRPISFPTARFSLGGISVVNFSERNQYRIPDYHRLDLSLTLRGNLKKNQKLKTSWTFGLYNAYGRKNPFTVFFGKRKITDPQLTPYQMSILAQPIPSVTLNINWN